MNSVSKVKINLKFQAMYYIRPLLDKDPGNKLPNAVAAAIIIC